MSLLGGRLCVQSGIPLPYFPLLIFFYSNQGGGGAWAAMPVVVVQPGFVNLGSKRGSEATERGEGVGGGKPPSYGREIFFLICVLKQHFLAH